MKMTRKKMKGPSCMNKTAPEVASQPFKIGKCQGDYTGLPVNQHLSALSRVLAFMAQYPTINVLAVHHRHGHMPLIVIEHGLLAWSLPAVRVGVNGRSNGKTYRYEALVEGVLIGWECTAAELRKTSFRGAHG
jgi:hypothetical protein